MEFALALDATSHENLSRCFAAWADLYVDSVRTLSTFTAEIHGSENIQAARDRTEFSGDNTDGEQQGVRGSGARPAAAAVGATARRPASGRVGADGGAVGRVRRVLHVPSAPLLTGSVPHLHTGFFCSIPTDRECFQ